MYMYSFPSITHALKAANQSPCHIEFQPLKSSIKLFNIEKECKKCSLVEAILTLFLISNIPIKLLMSGISMYTLDFLYITLQECGDLNHFQTLIISPPTSWEQIQLMNCFIRLQSQYQMWNNLNRKLPPYGLTYHQISPCMKLLHNLWLVLR